MINLRPALINTTSKRIMYIKLFEIFKYTFTIHGFGITRMEKNYEDH